MISTYKLDKPFGPAGTSAGIFLFLAGLVAVLYSLSGIILILIGAFMGFTNTSTRINTGERKIKFSNNFFGIIKVGKWIRIDDGMKIGIRKNNWTWRAYSRGNRTLDISEKDYRLFLYDPGGKEILAIKKTGSLESAKKDMEKLAKELGLKFI